MGTVADNGDGTDTVIFTAISPGNKTFTATIDGQQVTSTITVTVLSASLSQSSVSVSPTTIPIGGTASLTVIARDFLGNQEITVA